MHHIACAAAGANSTTSPCNGSNNYNWDTCADPNNPTTGCAWLATNDDELAAALSSIISDIIETPVPAGPPTVANDFQLSRPQRSQLGPGGRPDPTQRVDRDPRAGSATSRVGAAPTRIPNNPGQLADYCLDAATLPIETDETESFGPCPLGRVWDAGECLEQTAWIGPSALHPRVQQRPDPDRRQRHGDHGV